MGPGWRRGDFSNCSGRNIEACTCVKDRFAAYPIPLEGCQTTELNEPPSFVWKRGFNRLTCSTSHPDVIPYRPQSTIQENLTHKDHIDPSEYVCSHAIGRLCPNTLSSGSRIRTPDLESLGYDLHSMKRRFVGSGSCTTMPKQERSLAVCSSTYSFDHRRLSTFGVYKCALVYIDPGHYHSPFPAT